MKSFVTTIVSLLACTFSYAQAGYQDHIINGDFEGNNTSCFFSFDWYNNNIVYSQPRVITDPTDPSNHCAIVSTCDVFGGETFDVWTFLFYITLSEKFEVGDKVRLTMRIRADKSAECDTQAHDKVSEYNHNDMFGKLQFTTEWQTITREAIITADHVYGTGGNAQTSNKEMHSIAFFLYFLQEVNNYYFDDIKLEIEKAGDTNWLNLIRNDIYAKDKFTFSNTTFTTFTGRDGKDRVDRPARIEDDPKDGKPAIVVRSVAGAENDYDSQFFITTRHVFHTNERVKFILQARADYKAMVETELHKGPTDFLYWEPFGSFTVTEEWKTFEFINVITSDQDGGQTIALNLNVFKDKDNVYYFRDIQLLIDENDATEIDHIIGLEDLYLPVPEPEDQDPMKVAVDFSDCLQVLGMTDLRNLLSGKNMKVQSAKDVIPQESISATTDTKISNNGLSNANGSVKFHLDYDVDNKAYFVVGNTGGSFKNKRINTVVYFQKDGWYYAFHITFVDKTNYQLDTYRTIGIEDIYLPVPEPGNKDGAIASVDFTNCLQTFDTDKFKELISEKNMKVQESNGMLSQTAYSATTNGATFDATGSYAEDGIIEFKINEESKNKTADFHIYNHGDTFIGKNLKTRICFDQGGKYYVFGITFVDEPTYNKIMNVAGYDLSVIDEAGKAITEGIEIVWYDKDGQSIGTGNSLYNIKEGTEVYYSVLLNEELGRKYREVIKQKADAEVGKSDTCMLQRLEEVVLHGTVSAYSTVLPRVDVCLTQWLNGKYEYENKTLTDANGEFSLTAYNDSTELIVLANGYVDNKMVRQNLNNGGELGTIEMTEVSGKIVDISLSYQEATLEGTEPIVQTWYSDTRNIEYSVQNVTKEKAIEDFAIQQGNIVLPTGVDQGDKIQVTLRSLNDKFAEATVEGVIEENDTAKVSINLLALGGIEVTYEQKADDNLLAMLYDATGQLQMRTICSSSRLTLSNLAAGAYTLITMGYNGAIGSIADISDLTTMGLTEGTDYVSTAATVRDGIISTVNVASVPELDASKFEFTGSNTYFTPNKTLLAISNFITISTRVDFSEQYASHIHKAKIVVNIPEGCEFIAKSVVIGNKPVTHSLNGNRLTISLDEEEIDQRIRFCVYPTKAGTFLTTAYVEFGYEGEKTQSIGQISFEATEGELHVPSTTNTPAITVSGIGAPKAEVEVYDGESLIGTTNCLANGQWSLACELHDAYNLTTHQIYVKYRGDGSVVGQTVTKECFYDMNAIVVKKVTMLNTAHPAGDLTPKVYETVFDFINHTSTPSYYSYWPDYPEFTFLIDLSENDTTKVSNMALYVYTSDGGVRQLPAAFDSKQNSFVATGSFDTYGLPVNIAVDFSADTQIVPDVVDIGFSAEDIEALSNKFYEDIAILDAFFADSDSITDESLVTLAQKLQIDLSVNGDDATIDENIDSMTDEELGAYLDNLYEEMIIEDDAIIAEADKLKSWFELKSVMQETFGGNSTYSLNNCDGLTREGLLAEGYEETMFAGGVVAYTLTTDNTFSLVILEKNVSITITLPSVELGRVSLKALKAGYRKKEALAKFKEFVDKLSLTIETINNIFDDIIKTASKPTEVIEEVISKLEDRLKDAEKWENMCTKPGFNPRKQKWRLEKFRLQKALGTARLAKKICAPIIKGLLKCLPVLDYIATIGNCITNVIDLDKTFKTIPDPCPNDERSAEEAEEECVLLTDGIVVYTLAEVYGNFTADAEIVGGALASVATAGTSLAAVGWGIVQKVATQIAKEVAKYLVIDKGHDLIKQHIKNLKCTKEEDTDDVKTAPPPFFDPINPIHDPSGYVYEAVPTNRIEGVKATLFYDEDAPTQWNAEDYGQINPQITDESGLYAWDVPQGMWKVVFNKENYETAQTEWLPVPPPQLEVNIPMSQAVAPSVESARGTESGITLNFSKYMKPGSLTKNGRVSVTSNGQEVKGDVEMLNLEENPYFGEEYASKVKFVPNTAFKTTDEFIITVKKEVESYANKQMAEDFVQKVKIEAEINEIACDSLIAIDYQNTGVLEISVLPAAAAKGKVVEVTSASPMIATTDAQSVTLNDEGKASIVISGELPGTSTLHLSMPEVGIEKYVAVSVVMPEKVVKAPKASKLSGSIISDNYLLTLTCATKGAIIYYTTDGSCPCDEQKRKKYTGPITLPLGEVTLQTIAVREGMEDSEVATFNYTVQKGTDIKVATESRDFEANYQDGSIVISGVQGASCNIYDMQGHELASHPKLGKQTRIRVPKTDVYIVSVLYGSEQTIVHKIMAK